MLTVGTTHGQGRNHTYYYERVATVTGGNKTAANGDGHYLTMNSKVLYESNSDGTSRNCGMMHSEGDNNGLHVYGGNSYLGNGLTYFFASDYSRLNVRLYDGTILVYERKSQPNQSRMRQYSVAAPSSDGYTPSPEIRYDNSTPSGGNSRNNKDEKVYESTCVYCKGTGRQTITQSINVYNYGDFTPQYVTCSECNYRYDKKSTSHRHQTCSHCNGKGKIRVK